MEIAEQKRLIEIAIKASLLAGKEILKVYSGEFEVINKSDNSPLTLADQNANDVIEEHLVKTEMPILSEEGRDIPYDERKNWEYFWVVDPLDGTKEFVKRNGNFTVNIALMKNNSPLLGVIYIPVSDELYFGGLNIGSFSIKEFSKKTANSFIDLVKIADKLPNKKLPKEYTIVASSSHLSHETTEYMDKLKELHGSVKIISQGSSLKICRVAEGAAHEYPRFAPTMEWDIAAGHAIILGAGREIIDHSTQKRIQYNKENLLNNWFIVK